MNVELRDIHKKFGPVYANDGISIIIQAGTIQGILGENGAGKSTLMKILSGYIQADRGEILLDGEPVEIRSPADAIRHGIGMLHQDPLDFPPMKVIDNFLLGHSGKLVLNRNAIWAEFSNLVREFGFSLDPDMYMDTLTVGERQQVEILRLLWLGVQVLILDEPTTGISSVQKEKLFATLKLLAAQGKSVIFVSHKLEDVEQLCNKVIVLRQGKMVGVVESTWETNILVEMMFGKLITLEDKKVIQTGAATLVLYNLTIEDTRLKIEIPNLEVRAGEVIGLAGMEGSGQRPFLRACAGLVHPVSGKVFVGERDLTGKSYLTYRQHGVSYLPASRLEEGLIPGLTMIDHFILAEESAGLFIDNNKWKRFTQDRIESFNIHGRPTSRVETLSGGNQQRALLALLKTPLALILLEHPTRGLDIESVIYIWGKLKERCRQGTAIIFISSDLEEILRYSDRVLVFYSGHISPPLDSTTATVELLGQLIGGKGWDEIISIRGADLG